MPKAPRPSSSHPPIQHIATSHSDAPPSEPKGWYSSNFLPHFDMPGTVQHITYHLADSLPRPAVKRVRSELRSLQHSRLEAERHKRLQALLDQGMGSCLLRENPYARIVEDSFLHGDGDRYKLLAWTVMPNHVHVLVELLSGWALGKIVQSWKRHTSRQIHLLQMAHGQGDAGGAGSSLWHREYWDRYIRNEEHFWTVVRYIEENPVIAGLVSKPEEWAWGSARLRGSRRMP